MQVRCDACNATNRLVAFRVSARATCGRCGSSLREPMWIGSARFAKGHWAWAVLLTLVGGAYAVDQLRPISAGSYAPPTVISSACTPEQVYPGIYRQPLDVGIAPLRVVTSSGSNYFVKLVDVADGRTALTMFVKGGVPLEVDVPLGTYRVRYASGRVWCGEAELFGPETRFSEADRSFAFVRSGDQISGYTIELIQQRSGNLRTHAISATSF